MTIQVILYGSTATEKDGIVFSQLNAPKAIDDFDINIIDLSVNTMWTYNAEASGKIDAAKDLLTIQQMVGNEKKAIVVYALPQNIRYTYNTRNSSGKKTQALKDILDGVQKHSINAVIPQNTAMTQIAYEKTQTLICGHMFDADFYFLNPENIVTESEKSEKPTTIQIADRIFATTLNITKSNEELKHYISVLFEKHQLTEVPQWMEEVYFGDDAEQKAIIEKCEKQIEEANDKIHAAQSKLKDNAEIKSILYTNGDQLVSVVFKILEKLLDYDLSTFVDVKQEDFLIKKPHCTFIGEIKGVTSNVKYEHISQLELHYRKYLDNLNETETDENVKQLLIANPFRSKSLDMRDPVHTEQIELAERNGCLIIETRTLLRLYERLCANHVTRQQCEEMLEKYTGLLRISDIDEI